MNSFCPSCGFANSYQFQKPDTCRKCNKSLSFEKVVAEKQIITSSGLELTAAERRLIINHKDSSTPIEIAKLIFGDQITSSHPEFTLVRNFINSLENKEVKFTKKSEKYEATQMLNNILSGKRKKLEIQYDDEEEDDETVAEVPPDISGLSFTVENVEPPKSMTLEDAVFKYAAKVPADILNPKKVKIDSKKAFNQIKNNYFTKAGRSKSIEIQGQ